MDEFELARRLGVPPVSIRIDVSIGRIATLGKRAGKYVFSASEARRFEQQKAIPRMQFEAQEEEGARRSISAQAIAIQTGH